MSKKVTDTVQEMAQPIVDSLQLELVDIEFVKEGQSCFFACLLIPMTVWILRNVPK